MYVQPDVYDVEVRVADVGQATLPQRPLGPGEQIPLDIALAAGVDFRAKVVDSVTGDPVPGVRLWHYQYTDVVGRSDERGELAITAMRPGRFQFNVDAPGHARWWSEQAAAEHSRRHAAKRFGGWQRNSSYLEFDLKPGMGPATIVVERAVNLSGRVVDPDGKPFAGAIVALHLIYDDPPGGSSSGYSFERGEVQSDGEGRFRMSVPASNEKEYNLLAHDGEKPREWRTWANGVLPSFQTKPGDAIEGLEIHLTRPATLRGRIVNQLGVGMQGSRVYVSALDRLDDHQYDRAVQAGLGGTYEVKFLRPGAQLIRIDPFGSDLNGPIEPPSRIETLTPGEVREDVDVLVPAPKRSRVGPQAAR
jgi:protocatechuate 3,4-dioxygenase beta subunit